MSGIGWPTLTGNQMLHIKIRIFLILIFLIAPTIALAGGVITEGKQQEPEHQNNMSCLPNEQNPNLSSPDTTENENFIYTQTALYGHQAALTFGSAYSTDEDAFIHQGNRKLTLLEFESKSQAQGCANNTQSQLLLFTMLSIFLLISRKNRETNY